MSQEKEYDLANPKDKCELYFHRVRSELQTISTLKSKSESMHHAILKTHIVKFLRNIGVEKIETEWCVPNIGVVDVMGFKNDVSIAVECGNTSPHKILALQEVCDMVIHIPYCYTLEFFEANYEEIQHKLFVLSIAKRLQKAGIPVKLGVHYCLENCEGCDGKKLQKIMEEF